MDRSACSACDHVDGGGHDSVEAGSGTVQRVGQVGENGPRLRPQISRPDQGSRLVDGHGSGGEHQTLAGFDGCGVGVARRRSQTRFDAVLHWRRS